MLCLQLESQQIPWGIMDLGTPSCLSQIVQGTGDLYSLINQSLTVGCPFGSGVTLCKVCPCNQRPFSVRLADDIPSSLGMEMLTLERGPGWGTIVYIAG